MTDENQPLDHPGPSFQPPREEDKLHPGLTILSFCIPLAGAIIYFMNKDKYPNKAKTACYSALAGFGLGVIFRIIITIAEG